MRKRTASRYQKSLLPLVIILLAGSSLACGLGQGIDFFNNNGPTPTVDLGSGSGAAEENENATIAEESTSGEASAPTPEPAEAATPSKAESAEPSEEGAEDEPEIAAPLAENQIMILPGAEPPTMDPHLSGDASSAEYVVEVYSGLMGYNQDLELLPDIAESFEISDDGLVYTFKIRDDAVFQDGKPITAGDFKWSFERACDPATGSHTAGTYLGDIIGCNAKLQGKAGEIEGVQVIDDQTLELTIDEPKGFFLAKMTYPTAYVLDRENVEEGGEQWYFEPNSSGPFVLDTFTPEDGIIILTKNENYYGDSAPTLERVIFIVGNPINSLEGYTEGLGRLGLPDEVTYDAIQIGTANLSQATDPNNPLSKELETINSMSIFYIGFNVDKPPFDDVNVRQAFNLALDKRRMVKLVSQGNLPVATGIVPPNMPGYQNPDLSDFEFDPEQAMQLIEESPYGDVTELPEITLSVSGSGGGVGPIIEAIVESYRENLGVEVAVEQTPWPDFLADLNSPDPTYQMYQLGWIGDYPDPQNFLEVLFHSKSAQNHGGYSNPDADALLDQARGTQNVDDRQALYQEAEQLILEDAAWVPLYFNVENWLVKPYVHGFRVPPIQIPKFQYASIVDIEE